MDFQQIQQQLQQKQYAPIYFLHGEESYFIDQISDYIEANVLSDAEKSFNQTIFYGKEVDAKTLMDTCMRYPMMSSHQVVIIKEAQEMKGLKDILPYVQKPVPSTILVINHKHKKYNLNDALGKALKKEGVVFDSKPLYENQVPDWIVNYLKTKKLNINAEAATIMSSYLGTDLSKIVNEIEKLVINLPQGTNVTPQHIEAYIGISKDYNVFELQRALGNRDVVKANRIIQYFAANPRKNPLTVVIGAFYNYFSKILMLHAVSNSPEQEIIQALGLRSAFFLKEYRQSAKNFPKSKVENVIHVLKEYDLKSKGIDFNSTNTKEEELLKEMVWKILHA